MRRIMIMNALVMFFVFSAWSALPWAGPGQAEATPLVGMQSAERCDTCHVMPDKNDPKWVEENYKLMDRKCRMTCGACHINPSGGMLRNDTGMYFGTNTLPLVKGVPEKLKKGYDIVKSNGFVTLGGDFRFLDLIQDKREHNPVLFPMQADLYISARLMNHLTLMSQFGMERGGNATVREAFGMVDNLPFNAYFKLGKGIPPFGHRLDDHTAYIRSRIFSDHSMPESYYSLGEIGAEPLVFYVRGSYFNEDKSPSVEDEYSRRGGTGVIGWHGLWLNLGGSYGQIVNYERSSTLATDRSAYGVYGSLRIKDVPYVERFTYLFEYDIRDDKNMESHDTTHEYTTITFNELAYRVTDGVTVRVRHENFDPEGDSEEMHETRYTGAVDFHPYSFSELSMQYRYYDYEEKGQDQNKYDFFLLAHLWF